MSKAQMNYFLVLATIFVIGFFLSIFYIGSKMGSRVVLPSVSRPPVMQLPKAPPIPKAPKIRNPVPTAPKTSGVPTTPLPATDKA